MTKSVLLISSILQFLAVVIYFVLFRTAFLWLNGKANFEPVAITASIAIFVQIVSLQLKNKYKSELEKAENIMQDPKTSYGWIALGVFGLAVLFIFIYVSVTK